MPSRCLYQTTVVACRQSRPHTAVQWVANGGGELQVQLRSASVVLWDSAEIVLPPISRPCVGRSLLGSVSCGSFSILCVEEDRAGTTKVENVEQNVKKMWKSEKNVVIPDKFRMLTSSFLLLFCFLPVLKKSKVDTIHRFLGFFGLVDFAVAASFLFLPPLLLPAAASSSPIEVFHELKTTKT